MVHQEIPIEELTKLEEKYRKTILILVTSDEDSNIAEVTTGGKSFEDSNAVAELGNVIKREVFHWSEHLCSEKPNISS